MFRHITSLAILFIGNVLYSQKEYFDKFENRDSLSCFDFKYPFYYQIERDTIIDNYRLYQFRIGETKQKSANFWIGIKGEDLYTIFLSSDKVIKAEKLNFDGNKIQLLLSNGKKLKFKLTKKAQEPDGTYVFNVKNINQKDLFSKEYSHFSAFFDKKYGFTFYFIYMGQDLNSPYGGCYLW